MALRSLCFSSDFLYNEVVVSDHLVSRSSRELLSACAYAFFLQCHFGASKCDLRSCKNEIQSLGSSTATFQFFCSSCKHGCTHPHVLHYGACVPQGTVSHLPWLFWNFPPSLEYRITPSECWARFMLLIMFDGGVDGAHVWSLQKMLQTTGIRMVYWIPGLKSTWK